MFRQKRQKLIERNYIMDRNNIQKLYREQRDNLRNDKKNDVGWR